MHKMDLYYVHEHSTGINRGLTIVGSSGGGNQTCSSALVLHTLEIP